MFASLTKYCLWDLMSTEVKLQDNATEQVTYDGELRGETQRYLISAGMLVKDMFEKIESAFAYHDPRETNEEWLDVFLRTHAAAWKPAADDVATAREILAEIRNAYRMKGTRAFVHWVVYKVFGWHVRGIFSYNSLLYTNRRQSKLYDPTKSLQDQQYLYGEDMFTILAPYQLVVDVVFDPDFLEKKEVFEELIQLWTLPVHIEYTNTP